MERRFVNFILILILVAAVAWVDLPRAEGSTGIKIGNFERSLNPVLGLDLRGGMQVLLAPPEGITSDAQSLQDTAKILESRANGLGVSEVVFQVSGSKYIIGEFPGLTNTQDVISAVKQTGLLEFVDTGSLYVPEGSTINTDYGMDPVTNDGTVTPSLDGSGNVTPEDYVFHTVMTGSEIDKVEIQPADVSGFEIKFSLLDDGAKIFKDHTSANTNKFLAIVLDKTVISCPKIGSPITDGSGVISGSFTSESANNLAVTLRYGRLSVPVEVVESRVVGPSLGADSLQKSLLAGLIGFIVVALFMIIYYRLPGGVAVLAVAIFAGINFAIYKLLPVTLSLAGIAGFLLSTGSALDANILIFERLKEELRNGRTLKQAIDLGWKRAWPSIRDSNIATIITSIILFWFGSAYGASIVKGFALTLFIGVIVSLFTAIFVSRNFLTIVIGFIKQDQHQKWFGA